MGFNGYSDKRKKVEDLRRLGLSYAEIQKHVQVSKDTLSRWCRNIALTEDQINKLLHRKKTGGIKGSIIGAKVLQKRREERTLSLYISSKKEIGQLSGRDEFIAGVALYAAEGTKTDRVCEFTNADPEMIRFMVLWLRKFCNIDESKLRGSIWLHDDLDEQKAKVFWENLTEIPQSQFFKTYLVKRKTKMQRKQLHSYGIFSLRYLDSALSRRIIGWIAGLLGQKWYNDRVEKLHLIK
jgi:hypothetical protein